MNTPILGALLDLPFTERPQTIRVRHTRGALAAGFAELAGHADIIVTTGGVSVGEEDHIHAALTDASGQIAFAGVAMKPGKPVTVGRIGTALCICLLGNPVSAHVTWHVLGAPVPKRHAGLVSADAPLRVICDHDL